MSRSHPHLNHYERRRVHREAGPNPLTDRSCPQHKIAFSTERRALQNAAMAYKADGTVLRPYKCPHCRLWHLTSKV